MSTLTGHGCAHPVIQETRTAPRDACRGRDRRVEREEEGPRGAYRAGALHGDDGKTGPQASTQANSGHSYAPSEPSGTLGIPWILLLAPSISFTWYGITMPLPL